METVFPALLTFSYFAPTILRIGLALVFFSDAKKYWSRKQKMWLADGVAAVIGILILVGYGTQVAALLGVGYLAFVYYKKDHESVFHHNSTAFLALAMLLSLLVTGAGAIAFDLPY